MFASNNFYTANIAEANFHLLFAKKSAAETPHTTMQMVGPDDDADEFSREIEEEFNSFFEEEEEDEFVDTWEENEDDKEWELEEEWDDDDEDWSQGWDDED